MVCLRLMNPEKFMVRMLVSGRSRKTYRLILLDPLLLCSDISSEQLVDAGISRL